MSFVCFAVALVPIAVVTPLVGSVWSADAVWLGAIALSCVAGMVNVVGFLGFEHQAITHLTGTTSQLGMALVQHDWRNVGHLWGETAKIRTWMDALLVGVDEGWVRPHVDRTFPLADAAAAHRYLEQRRNTGKVVLTA